MCNYYFVLQFTYSLLRFVVKQHIKQSQAQSETGGSFNHEQLKNIMISIFVKQWNGIFSHLRPFAQITIRRRN